VTESKRGQTASQARDGLGHYGLNRVLVEPETHLTMCTLEFGTFDRESGQKAFRADHWLHKYGDPLGKEAEPVRAAMRRQFYPDTDETTGRRPYCSAAIRSSAKPLRACNAVRPRLWGQPAKTGSANLRSCYKAPCVLSRHYWPSRS
jgi:hypothetical protein